MKEKVELQCLEHLKISIEDPCALGKHKMKCNYCSRSFEKIADIKIYRDIQNYLKLARILLFSIPLRHFFNAKNVAYRIFTL